MCAIMEHNTREESAKNSAKMDNTSLKGVAFLQGAPMDTSPIVGEAVRGQTSTNVPIIANTFKANVWSHAVWDFSHSILGALLALLIAMLVLAEVTVSTAVLTTRTSMGSATTVNVGMGLWLWGVNANRNVRLEQWRETRFVLGGVQS